MSASRLRPVRRAPLATIVLPLILACGGATDVTSHHPPENGAIVFASDRTGSRELYVMNADGTNLHAVTSPVLDGVDYGVWSPDGRDIAFDTEAGQIRLLNSDGANVVLFDDGEGHGVVWSPDGQMVALDVHDTSAVEIGTVAAGGGALMDLTRNGARNYYPTWSPDSRRIAYMSDVSGEQAIYVMDAVGSIAPPVWSPDGTRLAFLTRPNGVPQVAVVNVASGDVARLTDLAAGASWPEWSPDGSGIVFSSGGDIYVMNADGTRQTDVTNDPTSTADSPDWGAAP
ncbi:MAG TPA: DPP IV N-terminal domain-containing protein [Gemmatimonadaceae bacterium]|nr:DPP IV N-terminal domain-containing protein [Gemmatimonadaceae bacterium]